MLLIVVYLLGLFITAHFIYFVKSHKGSIIGNLHWILIVWLASPVLVPAFIWSFIKPYLEN